MIDIEDNDAALYRHGDKLHIGFYDGHSRTFKVAARGGYDPYYNSWFYNWGRK